MKLRIFFTFLFLSIYLTSTFAQSNFRRGFIITNEGDTVSGWIDFGTDAQNMHICNFRETEMGTTRTFFPGQIFGYRFYEEGKFYVSREIVINDEPRTVFLEFLLQGNMNLFYYIDVSQHKQTEYYFFENQSGRMIALTKRPDEIISTAGGITRVNRDFRYRGVIRYLFNEHESIAQQADKVEFNHQSMIDIARQYHNLTCPIGEESIVFEIKTDTNFIRTQFSIYSGAMIFADAQPIMIGGRVNISNPHTNRNLSFQSDLGFARVDTQNIPNFQYQRDVLYFFPFQLGTRYAFGMNNAVRPTLGLGAAILSVYSTQLSSFGFSPLLGYASVGLEGKLNEQDSVVFLDIELLRDILPSFNDNFGAHSENVFGFFLQVKFGFRF